MQDFEKVLRTLAITKEELAKVSQERDNANTQLRQTNEELRKLTEKSQLD